MAHQILTAASAAGLGQQDQSSVITLLEAAAGVKVRVK